MTASLRDPNAPAQGAQALLRWGVVGVSALIGLALIATVVTTRAAIVSASETVLAGELSTLMRAVQLDLRQGHRAPSTTELEALLETHANAGLRYLAVVHNGAVVVEAGDAAEPLTGWPPPRPDEPIRIGDRVRIYGPPLVHGPPREPPPHMRRRGPPPRGPGLHPPGGPPRHPVPQLVIEAEPSVSSNLRAEANRTLVVGAIAALLLLLAAVGAYRLLNRLDRATQREQHQRKLAALGEMSAVLAHEIRNPLASLKGHAQLLGEALPAEDKHHKKAQRIIDEALRLERLTEDLLSFVRSGRIEPSPTDPGALLRHASATVGDERVVVELGELPEVWPLDHGRMTQVMENLLRNAVQASPEDGVIVARAEAARGKLRITVRDHGDGITDADRMFEPFVTSRVRGTGLGLAIAKQIVEAHGGTITAANVHNGGAELRIELPSTAR